jgi:hypothetical protein
MTTANTDTPASLDGVSCLSAGFCMAVGYHYTAFHYLALAELWNGSTWSSMTVLDPDQLGANLFSVSCTSSTFCVAVGDYQDSMFGTLPLAEEWNGSQWSTIAPTVARSGAVYFDMLTGVSCTSTNFCVAVGMQSDHGETPLAEVWDGARWSVMDTVNPGAGPDNLLNRVSCTSVIFCVAAGMEEPSGGGYQTLIEDWNGATWSTMTSLSPGSNSELKDASCTSVNFCVAVGYTYTTFDIAGVQYQRYRVFAEVWNGSLWSASITPSPPSDTKFYGTSCASSSFCVADGGPGATVAESYRTLT